ncbi:MAG: hypothetical protein KGS09_11185 [Nitrospirae bacterium]|nr:hypothetical protein [Nitrospirota bacterium]MDE3050741.1 hypothetical protein [Nitrospirota bacterium]
MVRQRQVMTFLLVGIICAISACAFNSPNYEKLAEYLHSPEGFAQWQQMEGQLAKVAESAATEYNRTHTMEALRSYETAIREYLDHGFLLYHAFSDSPYDLPKGLRRSLERRTAELMDVADGYLKEHSIPIAVGIAREVILKYNAGVMDHPQHRAEGIMLEYRYRRN